MKWPKLRFFSSFMALVFLVACAQKESRNDFGVLVGLNEDPSERVLSQNLEKDLLAQYKFEKSSWFDEMKSKGFGKKEYKKKNLFLFDQATKANEKTFNKLQALKMKPRKKPLSPSVLTGSFSQSKKYKFLNDEERGDPKKMEIGYCFYRALLTHYYLLENGVPQGRIGKIWAIGSLVAPPVVWNFHVATFVKTEDGVLILDSMFERPLPLMDWTKEILKLSGENPYPQLRFYVSDPRKFLPSSGEYSKTLMNHGKIKAKTDRLIRYLNTK